MYICMYIDIGKSCLIENVKLIEFISTVVIIMICFSKFGFIFLHGILFVLRNTYTFTCTDAFVQSSEHCLSCQCNCMYKCTIYVYITVWMYEYVVCMYVCKVFSFRLLFITNFYVVTLL